MVSRCGFIATIKCFLSGFLWWRKTTAEVCVFMDVCVCQVAKSHGDPETQKQVAYMWARSLGGEAAVKLLSKFGLLEHAIEMASNKK